MKKTLAKSTGCIVFLCLFLPNIFYAQTYHGGIGDGNAKATASAQSLGRNIFLGGIDDGESLAKATTQSLGRNIFLGGVDDGESLAKATTQSLGRNIFLGGIDDGESLAKATTQSLGRNIFLGGVDDGESLGKGNTQQLGRNIFTGGADDGWAMAFVSNLQLPIVLKDFMGEWQQNNALLNWQTSTESNSANFVLERSFDGLNFTGITTVNAAGQSNAVLNYSYTDVGIKSLLPQGITTIYYRLKSVDKDGTFTYSGIVVLKTEVSGIEYAVFPNPASQYINIRANNLLPNTTSYVRLADVNGKMIMLQQMTSNTMQLHVSTLLPGSYFLQILTENKPVYSQKIIIQK